MQQHEVIAKAQLLREEITDIIAFDPEEEDFNEVRVLTKACTWVFRHQDAEKVAQLVAGVRSTTWTQSQIRAAINGAFNG